MMGIVEKCGRGVAHSDEQEFVAKREGLPFRDEPKNNRGGALPRPDACHNLP